MTVPRLPARALPLILALAWVGACSQPQVIGEPRVVQSPAFAQHPNGRVLIVVSSHAKLGDSGEATGYWLSEVTHFYHVVARHGFAVDFVSPTGAPAAMDPASRDLDDDLNRAFVENPSLHAALDLPLAPTAVDPSRYVAIYFAGGHGTMWDFASAAAVAELAARIWQAQGFIAAVCHGPAGLLAIQGPDGRLLIAGKRVTGFANVEERLVGKASVVPYSLQDRLTAGGGLYEKALLPFSAHVVRDGRLITGQNPRSAAGVAEALVEALEQGRR